MGALVKPTHQYIGGDPGMPDFATDVFAKNVKYVSESTFDGCGVYVFAAGESGYHIDKQYIKEVN